MANPNTGKLNVKIIVNEFSFDKSAAGAPVKSLADTWDLWAEMESLNGSRYLDNLQLTYSKAYRVKTRYEVSRPIAPETHEIVYQGKTYVIQSVIPREEGRRNFNEMIIYRA